MKIDTLVMSGGGPSGIAYIGIFKALIEKGILTNDLSGIKEIIVASVGIVFAYLYMLDLPEETQYKIVMGADIFSVLNAENITIDDLLVDFGLFKTDNIRELMYIVTKHCFGKEDITLQELYDKTQIKLKVKVFNVTLKQVQYISYENHPEISFLTLVEMAIAIPLFFKPVKYKDELYVDGGLRGHFPIEACESDNYLGLFLAGGIFPKDSELIKVFPILEFLYSLMINQDPIVYQVRSGETGKKIVYTEINQGLNFDVSQEDKDKMIEEGYECTLKHIAEHLQG